jgi:hypothetical protein
LIVSLAGTDLGSAFVLSGGQGAWVLVEDHALVSEGAAVSYRYEGDTEPTAAGSLHLES